MLSSGGSGGGSGASTAVPSTPAQFNIVGQSSTNQLAQTISAQQSKPIQAYVFGSEITTQQALDRNRVNNSTFL